MITDTARAMSAYERTNITQQWIALSLATVGGILALRQLAIASTAALLQSEVMIFNGLHEIDKATADLFEMMALPTETDLEKRLAEIKVRAAQMRQCGAIQNYLNSLDRYCSCVLRYIVSRRRARKEYKSAIDESFIYRKNLPDFEFERHFPSLVKLREKWR